MAIFLHFLAWKSSIQVCLGGLFFVSWDLKNELIYLFWQIITRTWDKLLKYEFSLNSYFSWLKYLGTGGFRSLRQCFTVRRYKIIDYKPFSCQFILVQTGLKSKTHSKLNSIHFNVPDTWKKWIITVVLTKQGTDLKTNHVCVEFCLKSYLSWQNKLETGGIRSLKEYFKSHTLRGIGYKPFSCDFLGV